MTDGRRCATLNKHGLDRAAGGQAATAEEGEMGLKYLKQFGIILFLSFVGEILHELVPLPVPASIYGIILLFLCLEWRVISVSAVKEASSFLIEIMPVMFIPAAVGLMDSWENIKNAWIPYMVITLISTFGVMAAAGKAVQFIMNWEKKNRKEGK